MSYSVRPAIAADVAAIATLLQELYREEGYASLADESSLMHTLFSNDRAVQFNALVAKSDKTILGVLLYYPGYDTLSASYGYHLADIVVTRTHRQHGIGKALMKALAARTLAEQKEWVSLTMLKNNNKARLFYASCGMTQVEVDFFAIGKTALAML